MYEKASVLLKARLKMRILSASILGLGVLTGCATSSSTELSPYSKYLPPKIGTLVTYTAVSEGVPEELVKQLVVATGDDYALYVNLPEYGNAVEQDDYFLEFSGLYWHVCGDIAPSATERRNLQSMWPIKEGAQTTLNGMDLAGKQMPVTVKILETRTPDAGSLISNPVFDVRTDWETPEITTFIPEKSVAMRISWGEAGSDNYSGYDQLANIEQVDLVAYKAYVDYGVSRCLPANLN